MTRILRRHKTESDVLCSLIVRSKIENMFFFKCTSVKMEDGFQEARENKHEKSNNS